MGYFILHLNFSVAQGLNVGAVSLQILSEQHYFFQQEIKYSR